MGANRFVRGVSKKAAAVAAALERSGGLDPSGASLDGSAAAAAGGGGAATAAGGTVSAAGANISASARGGGGARGCRGRPLGNLAVCGGIYIRSIHCHDELSLVLNQHTGGELDRFWHYVSTRCNISFNCQSRSIVILTLYLLYQ